MITRNKEANWKRILPVVVMALLLFGVAFASIIEQNTGRLEYKIDSGIRKGKINITDVELAYQVRAGTFPQYLNKSTFGLDMMLSTLPPNITDIYNISNIEKIRHEITWYALSVRLNNSNGSIRFKETIDLSSYSIVNITKYINISTNWIEINATGIPAFSQPAVINITGLSEYSNVRVLKNDDACIECKIITFTDGNLVFDAPGFTIYRAVNGTPRPAIKVSTKVNITRASINVTGDTYNNSYPENVSIDIGNDGIIEYLNDSLLSTTITVSNLSNNLQSLISDCSCTGCSLSNSDLTCTIEIEVASNTSGTVELTALNISQVIANATWNQGNNYSLIDLDDYFYDRNNVTLVYNNTEAKNITVEITDGIVKLIPDRFYFGTRSIKFNATDGQNISYSNNITLTILMEQSPPTVTLVTPTNASNISIANVTLSFNVSDDFGIRNCSLYHNLTGAFSLNQSVDLSAENNESNFNLTGLLDNTSILWNVECFDIHNSSNFSMANWTVNIFIPPPVVYVTNATFNGSGVRIWWNSSVGATAYNIYAANDTMQDTFVFLNQTTLLSYIDYNATNYTSRYYKITALDDNAESLEDTFIGMHRYTLERKNESTAKNWIALAFNDSSLVKASQLLSAIPNVTSVVKWNSTSQFAVTCNTESCPLLGCTPTACDFDIEKGMVYEIHINASDPEPIAVNYTFAGLVHTPMTLNLTRLPGTYSKNYISVDANSTLTNVNSMRQSIGNVKVIRRWVPDTQTTKYWLNIFGGIGTNFNILPYEGYEVIPNANMTWSQE